MPGTELVNLFFIQCPCSLPLHYMLHTACSSLFKKKINTGILITKIKLPKTFTWKKQKQKTCDSINRKLSAYCLLKGLNIVWKITVDITFTSLWKEVVQVAVQTMWQSKFHRQILHTLRLTF